VHSEIRDAAVSPLPPSLADHRGVLWGSGRSCAKSGSLTNGMRARGYSRDIDDARSSASSAGVEACVFGKRYELEERLLKQAGGEDLRANARRDRRAPIVIESLAGHRVYCSPALPPPLFQLEATSGVAAPATLHSAGVALRLLTQP